jgi:hypothetical protein
MFSGTCLDRGESGAVGSYQDTDAVEIDGSFGAGNAFPLVPGLGVCRCDFCNMQSALC